jgi:hypothetical protein
MLRTGVLGLLSDWAFRLSAQRKDTMRKRCTLVLDRS